LCSGPGVKFGSPDGRWIFIEDGVDFLYDRTLVGKGHRLVAPGKRLFVSSRHRAWVFNA
jgi:hypothetical protein